MIKALKILAVFILIFAIIQTARIYCNGSTIPNYKYRGIDGAYHSKNDLPKTPVIFVYFSPDCGFCEKAIPELKNLHKKTSYINFVFITNQKFEKMVIDFIESNKLTELTNAILIDEKDSFPVDFGLGMVYSTPTFLLYNKNGNFVKKITDYKEIKSIKI
ncbi:TlpA family protein disulfide reductase [Pedobacter sp. SL55]|uniref:TlpA family protein disulfide reductase n=1 Tax=Pedobacter sp. SL55 TaxID=2995161 RepID=UPI00226F5775|nr:TlpA disulfide reductase family protein [Pedobacter sp. SL55]WAC41527.1 TlpA disulfide reductase family protein [Pedobacter sp. SL55]